MSAANAFASFARAQIELANALAGGERGLASHAIDRASDATAPAGEVKVVADEGPGHASDANPRRNVVLRSASHASPRARGVTSRAALAKSRMPVLPGL
jgi:hypothetical protein